MKIRKSIKQSIQNYKKYKKSILTKSRPEKKLLIRLKSHSGRNNTGQITVRHKYSHHKKLYRVISFKRKYMDQIGVVKTIEYDPNRSAFISKIEYKSKEDNTTKLEYILHVENLKVDDQIICSQDQVEIKPGNCTKLKNIPQGTIISNVAQYPNKGGQIARSAGSYVSIIDHVEKDYTILSLKSKFMIKVKNTCFATIGAISNTQHKNLILYKAGQNRHRGIRPTVRGVAMNPVDHPHGGGEGKTGTKRHPVSYTCKPTKGYKTTGKRSKQNKFIIKRK